jgi:hypothetical protein
MKKILSLIGVLSIVLMFNACSEEEGTLFEIGANDYWSFHAAKQTVNANASGKSVVYLYHINDAKVTPVDLTVAYIGGSNTMITVATTSINAVDEDGNKAAIEITYDFESLDYNVPYKVEISIPAQDGYAVEDQLVETVEITIVRPLTFSPIGTGLFVSAFFEESWEQPVSLAEQAEVYQCPGLYATGYDVNFMVDGSTVTVPEQFGWKHSTYGDISIQGTGTKEGNVLTVSIEHFVPGLGSFGAETEVLTLPAQ